MTNTCHPPDEMELLGTGGLGKTKCGYYDGYWCEKCKRLYIDSHFFGGYGINYSPKDTKEFMKWRGKSHERGNPEDY